MKINCWQGFPCPLKIGFRGGIVPSRKKIKFFFRNGAFGALSVVLSERLNFKFPSATLNYRQISVYVNRRPVWDQCREAASFAPDRRPYTAPVNWSDVVRLCQKRHPAKVRWTSSLQSTHLSMGWAPCPCSPVVKPRIDSSLSTGAYAY